MIAIASNGFLLALLASLLLFSSTLAQPGTNPAWTSFNRDLSSGDIRTVFVDSEGTPWFGTANGIDYFDGQWHSFTAEDGLPPGPVNSITQTADGTLWAATDGGLGKAVSSDQKWTWSAEQPPFPPGPVFDLWVSPDDTLWAATPTGAARRSEIQWELIPVSDPEGNPSPIVTVAGSPSGQVWLGGDSLFRVPPGKNQAFEIASTPVESEIQALLVTPATAGRPETLWVGTKTGGVWSLSDDWLHFSRPPESEQLQGIVSNDVLALAQDAEGTLWIGTNGGGISLFNPDGLGAFWDGGTWQSLTTLDGLAADAVADIHFDSNGLAWIGTINGASRFDGRTWRTLSSPDVPAGLDVSTILVDSAGGLWVGTDLYGLIYFDGHDIFRITEEHQGLAEDFVRSLVLDRDGNLWIGTARQGIAIAPVSSVTAAARQGTPVEWQQVFDEEQLGSNVLRAAIRADDDSLWFGTFAGLAHYKPGRDDSEGSWEVFGVSDGLANSEISQNALVEDSQGRIWAGTPTGLTRFDPENNTWQTFTTEDGLSDNWITSVVALSPNDQNQDTILAGTRTGDVFRFDPEDDQWQNIIHVTTPVFALLESSDGDLFVGTATGLERFDLEKELRTAYGRSDGLIDNEIHALATGDSGEVWIGTELGISRYRSQAGQPSVTIDSVNGKAPLDGLVQVLGGEPVIVAFHGNNETTPAGKLSYRTRLSESASEWQLTDESQITYDSLRPGTHRFEVEAWDSSLNLSQPATVDIEVQSSFALPGLGRLSGLSTTLLAGLAVIAALGVIGIMLLSSRQRQRQRQAVKRQFNPYISGEPVQDHEMFFGRHDVMEKIINMLHENSIMIHGERRIGKTSVLHYLSRELSETDDPDYLFVPVFIDLEGTKEGELFHVMMEEIAGVARGYLPSLQDLRFDKVAIADYDHREFSRDLERIIRELGTTTDKKIRLILLLDEMDIMNDYSSVTQQQLRRIFMRTYARNLGAVVAGIEISKEWDRVESPWYNLFNEVELGPLDDDDARELVMEPVKGSYAYELQAVDFIVSHAGGRPYYIQQHCLEAINIMLADGRNTVTLEDASDAFDSLASVRSSQSNGLSQADMGTGTPTPMV
ncbi:MAG: two-component regulator propeller domain-containing protein [Chloroflexota bacterium]|nr:two-component regulator propeller domain-containing protein [Chloroflexota bacterium]